MPQKLLVDCRQPMRWADCASDYFLRKTSLSVGTVGQSYDGHKPSEKPHAVGDFRPKKNSAELRQ